MELKLPDSKYKVIIKDILNWGEVEDLDDIYTSAMVATNELTPEGETISKTKFDGSILKKHKYKLFKTSIKSIRDDKDQEILFSEKFLRNLSYKDGGLIKNSCQELLDGIKKK